MLSMVGNQGLNYFTHGPFYESEIEESRIRRPLIYSL